MFSIVADLFVLRVKGDSMIEAHIADGDYVICRSSETAERGQMVVALNDENEATLKYWYPERNRIRLQPANSAMKPIYVAPGIRPGHRGRRGAEQGVTQDAASGCLSLLGPGLVQLVVQRLQADAQFFGGDGLVAVVAVQGLVDGVHFQVAKPHRAQVGQAALREL